MSSLSDGFDLIISTQSDCDIFINEEIYLHIRDIFLST